MTSRPMSMRGKHVAAARNGARARSTTVRAVHGHFRPRHAGASTPALIAGLLLGACSNNPCPGDAAGIACVYAGTGELARGADGLAPRDTALYWAFDMEFAPDGTPYLIDWNNHLIRRVRANDTIETVIGGDFVGDGPADMSDLMAPGAPGITCQLNHPTDLQFDDQGRLLLMAWHNHKLRVWDPETELITVAAGRGADGRDVEIEPGVHAFGGTGDGATMGAGTRFNQPRALVRASDGTLYIQDQRSFRIRRVGADGMVSTIVGTGVPGFAGDGGPADEAQLRFEAGPNPEPSGALALDEANGLLYIGDALNFRIRRVDLASGTIETVVGTGTTGSGGDGGPGLSAQISHVRDIEVGPDGRIYFADTENHRVRAWDPETDRVTTVVGTGNRGTGAEGQSATSIDLDRPMGVAFGPDGALYVGDTMNSRFLRVVL